MFSKNLKYLRLKADISKKELAVRIGVTPMAITHYESNERKPSMAIIEKLADALQARPVDFLHARNDQLQFAHGDFRKRSTFSKGSQEHIREEVEEYFDRFYNVVEVLGEKVLVQAPQVNALDLLDDDEENAENLRIHLGFAKEGPIGNLIGILENIGILVYQCDIDDDRFDGMTGTVESRPYIILNAKMNPERQRSTLSHELAHMFFRWPEDADRQQIEKRAMAIGGAFLFPKDDAMRELGVKRQKISADMILVAKEYGISMQLLAIRARVGRIINDAAYKTFAINASKTGWKKHEPSRIEKEKPVLFEQLVYRAVNEEEISLQKGAELLRESYENVAKNCGFNLDDAINL